MWAFLRLELIPAGLWYLLCVAIGWISFPLSSLVFRHFPDRGFTFAKAQGLFLIAYFYWISGSLVPGSATRRTLWLIVFAYLILNIIIAIYRYDTIFKALTQQIKMFLLLEGIFLLIFLGAVVVRMYNPDITFAEKEADFTFLNAILTDSSFPPKDSWFAGAHINYYYFGYVIWSSLIQLSGIISPIGYNLALATILALTAVAGFGLTYHLTRRFAYGWLAFFLLTLSGNLDGLMQWLEKLPFSPWYTAGSGALTAFDWWRSSRIIPDTINEFPYFSFLLGDLHPHFMSLPFLLLVLGLLLQWMDALRQPRRGSFWLVSILLSLSLGGSAVINSWDSPTVLILTALCVIAAVWRWQLHFSVSKRLLLGGAFVGLLALLSYLFFLPFHRHFTPQISASALRLVPFEQRTQLDDVIIIYGLFFWIMLLVVYEKWIAPGANFSEAARTRALLWWNSGLLSNVVAYLLLHSWLIQGALTLAVMLAYRLYRDLFSKKRLPLPPDISLTESHSRLLFPSLLAMLACAILAGCELIYIKDFYGPPLQRQNTIFKFHYQVWLLLSISMPCLLAYILPRRAAAVPSPGNRRTGWKIGFALLIGAGCIYPIQGTLVKTNSFRGGNQGGLLYLPTLNGISHIAYKEPYEYEALLWAQDHLSADAVILEATGDPYSYFGRVATTTGRSTVLGWGNHEALWRDQTWQSIQERSADIRAIYDAPDKRTILPLLRQYGVTHIFVGSLERSNYAPAGLKAFQGSFHQVFQNSAVTIYATEL